MAVLQENSFTSFSLTNEEELKGQIYSPEQLYVLRNLLSETAEGRLNIRFDPKNPIEFGIQESFAKGKIELLQYLIATHEFASSELQKLLAGN